MLQAFRLQQGNATLSYQADEGGARRAEVRRAGGPRRGALAQRLVAAQRRRHRRQRESTAVGAAFPQASRTAARQTERRESSEFTEFDGYVPGGGRGARSVLRPAMSTR